jgi:hypothetical protein
VAKQKRGIVEIDHFRHAVRGILVAVGLAAPLDPAAGEQRVFAYSISAALARRGNCHGAQDHGPRPGPI